MNIKEHYVGYLYRTHKTRVLNQYLHYGCLCCNESLGRSGVFYPKYGVVKCYQSHCKFNDKWFPAYKYIAYVNGVNKKDALDIIKTYKPVSLKFDEDTNNNTYKVVTNILLPDGYIPINVEVSNDLSKVARNYVRSRGFCLDWLYNNYKIGYVIDPKAKYYGRVIIPFFTRLGNLIYFQGRDFLNRGSRKRWDNPTIKRDGIGSSEVIYNELSLYKYKTVFITEGSWDALEIEKPILTPVGGCSFSGLNFTNHHLSFFIDSPCTEINISLDYGTYLKSLNIAYKLYNGTKGKDIYIIINPYEDKKDCNALGKEGIFDLYNSNYRIKFDNEVYMIELDKVFKLKKGGTIRKDIKIDTDTLWTL